jgi:hypothetical protein
LDEDTERFFDSAQTFFDAWHDGLNENGHPCPGQLGGPDDRPFFRFRFCLQLLVDMCQAQNATERFVLKGDFNRLLFRAADEATFVRNAANREHRRPPV